jgi:aldehyde dehydrogenase (NAD+)
MADLVQDHVIDGQIVPPNSSTYIELLNPVTGELAGKAAAGDKVDVDRAVAAAARAFRSWRNTSLKERADRISQVALGLALCMEELIELEVRCTGLLAGRLRGADLPAIMQFVQTFSEGLEDYPFVEYPPVHALPEAYDVRVIKQPLGVCGLIPAWNAPLFLSFAKILPAIAAGNTVVLKPSESASLAITKAVELMQGIFPPGVINLVTGYGHEAGDALVRHPNVAKISFTGSDATGKIIQRTAADTLKRVTLELGGKGPGIALPGAPVELTARGASTAYLLGSGQICVSGTRLFLHDSVHDAIVERMIEIAAGQAGGDPHDESVTLGPMAFRGHYQRVLDYLDIGRAEGATVACGGAPMKIPGYENGLFVQPTIFTDVTSDMRIYNEEIFGPVLSVIRYSRVEDAIAMANDSCFGLSAGVWGPDPIAAQAVANELEAGTVWVNDWHALTAELSFGGVKQSGYGREIGLSSLEDYLETRNRITAFETDPAAKFNFAQVCR